jgi:hypothetical protein
MGKKAHGRLVHEVREVLYRAGFMPTRITQLDTPRGLRAARSPGFKVEKHNDGKSVRLFHVTAGVSAEFMSRHSKLSPWCSQMERLLDYNTALEQEGFTRVAVHNRDRLASYSLWRRPAEAAPSIPGRQAGMMGSETAGAAEPFKPKSPVRVSGAS